MALATRQSLSVFRYLWETVYNQTDHTITSLTASEKLMCVIERDSLGTALDELFLVIGKNKVDTILNELSSKPKLLIENKEGERYIAGLSWGLINIQNGKRLVPSGSPFSSNIFALSSSKDRVFASSGGVSTGIVAKYISSGFYYFKDNRWFNVNGFSTDGLEGTRNYLDTKENPVNGKVYSATTVGLVEYDYNTGLLYDTSNSILEKQVSGGNNLYITGVDFDSKGNTWVINSHTNLPLKVLSKTGEWYKYTLKTGGSNQKYSGIFVDSKNQVWVRSFRNGISVFPSVEDLAQNHNGTDLLLNTGTANLPHNNVNTIAEDKNGSIWVGTDEGIGVFDCPEDLFDATADCKLSRRIKSTLDEYTEYLFDTDVVTAIAVDGANRKWIGTSAGLWLVSESGDKVLLSFNTENSPMPTNEVNSIAIDPLTGEVFVGTPFGMVSYVSDATEPADDPSNIKAFPNPIPPDYHGTISVTGLVKNTYVKITDINGSLIHDGYALGGKFVWDGKGYNGRRANSGVYLVFAADNKNKNKAVAKIIFVN